VSIYELSIGCWCRTWSSNVQSERKGVLETLKLSGGILLRITLWNYQRGLLKMEFGGRQWMLIQC